MINPENVQNSVKTNNVWQWMSKRPVSVCLSNEEERGNHNELVTNYFQYRFHTNSWLDLNKVIIYVILYSAQNLEIQFSLPRRHLKCSLELVFECARLMWFCPPFPLASSNQMDLFARLASSPFTCVSASPGLSSTFLHYTFQNDHQTPQLHWNTVKCVFEKRHVQRRVNYEWHPVVQANKNKVRRIFSHVKKLNGSR